MYIDWFIHIINKNKSVSLEVDDEGKPKAPLEAVDDGLPKLYIHHNAFLKVLGATVDVDTTNITPILYDKEGFEMDANVWGSCFFLFSPSAPSRASLSCVYLCALCPTKQISLATGSSLHNNMNSQK